MPAQMMPGRRSLGVCGFRAIRLAQSRLGAAPTDDSGEYKSNLNNPADALH